MPKMCRVEQSQVHGKISGLRIVHPEMGLIMDWGRRSPAAAVHLVPQEMAFQMMADIERIKTRRFERELRTAHEPAGCHASLEINAGAVSR